MKTMLEQLKRYRLLIIYLYIPVIVVLTLIQVQKTIPFAELTKDRASLMKVKFYWGLLSNIGILMWTITAAICIFTFFLLRNRSRKKLGSFFLYAGVFSAILAIDDFFFFHDIIFPQILGIYEEAIFLVYFVVIVIFIIKFKDIILKETDNVFLFLAFVFFVGSLIVDIATHNSFTPHFTFGAHHYLEDGSKFLGIMSWLIYFSYTAYKQTLKSDIKLSPMPKTASTKTPVVNSPNQVDL